MCNTTHMVYRVIELTKGFVAIIDAEDFRKVNRYSWHMHKSKGTAKKPGQPYARATIKGKKVYLHRYVINAPSTLQVDRRNHQTLDCRKTNLEAVEHIVNQKRRRNVKKPKPPTSESLESLALGMLITKTEQMLIRRGLIQTEVQS